jgi:nucleoside-diphosphate-sugar epimerase
MAIDSARRNTIKVVMLGGAGFLGYFTCTELMRRGHRAIAVGLAEPKPGLLPAGCSFASLNADTCTDAELMALLDGADAVIHATGADGRNSFPAPAIDGFRAANVTPVERLVRVMQQARVPRLVIMASYYTALARLFPDMGFLGHNPYPVSRHEQAKAAFAAGPDLDIAVLELPFIFGGAPGRGTLWGFIIDKIQKAEGPVPVGAGGVGVRFGGTGCGGRGGRDRTVKRTPPLSHRRRKPQPRQHLRPFRARHRGRAALHRPRSGPGPRRGNGPARPAVRSRH